MGDRIERGKSLFQSVVELDPEFAGGHAGLSFNHSVKVRFQYSASPSEGLARAFELARKAVATVRRAQNLEPNRQKANLFMGFYRQFAEQSGR